jgi:DNA polymerase III epsilon subunit-like protein
MQPNIWDTETTGIPDWSAPSDAEHQPHLVEIAALLCDAKGAIIDQFTAIIRPAGWIIPDDVAAIHGITTERAMDEGIPEAEAVDAFLALHAQADLRVAHGANFDNRIMRIAISRYHGKACADIFKAGDSYCTAQNSRGVLNLPKKKMPALAEAHKHFTGLDLVDAHRAMPDALACARVYFALQGITMPEAGAQLPAAVGA